MKRTVILTAAALAALTLASCAKQTAQNTIPADALVIAKQGVFASGGTVTAPVAGDYAPEKKLA